MAEAGKRGLKVMLTLVNYWTAYGGMAQYVKYVPIFLHKEDHIPGLETLQC